VTHHRVSLRAKTVLALFGLVALGSFGLFDGRAFPTTISTGPVIKSVEPARGADTSILVVKWSAPIHCVGTAAEDFSFTWLEPVGGSGTPAIESGPASSAICSGTTTTISFGPSWPGPFPLPIRLEYAGTASNYIASSTGVPASDGAKKDDITASNHFAQCLVSQLRLGEVSSHIKDETRLVKYQIANDSPYDCTLDRLASVHFEGPNDRVVTTNLENPDSSTALLRSGQPTYFMVKFYPADRAKVCSTPSYLSVTVPGLDNIGHPLVLTTKDRDPSCLHAVIGPLP